MRILMICSNFAPKNIIGAVRTSKICKYLVRLGAEVTVISPELNEYDIVDNSLECEELDRVKRVKIPFSGLTRKLTKEYFYRSKNFSEKKVEEKGKQKLIYKYARALFSSYRDLEWGHKVKRYIVRNGATYDIVFSSSPLVATHNIAKYMKRARFAQKWVADFRDPIALESSRGLMRLIQLNKQESIINSSDAVTVVTSGMKKEMCRNNKYRDKFNYISNGYDKDDLLNEGGIFDNGEDNYELNKQLVFAYTGGLFKGERDVSPLFCAIKELIQEEKLKIEDFKVLYAGKDSEIITAQASKYGLEAIIENKGHVSRQDAITIQKRADCVIVATFCYSNGAGAMTGKIYEPIMLHKPILLLVRGNGKNSEPVQFIEKLNAGCTFEESNSLDSIQKIKDYIMEIYTQKYQYGFIPETIDIEKLEEYSYAILVDKLYGLFTALLKN